VQNKGTLLLTILAAFLLVLGTAGCAKKEAEEKVVRQVGDPTALGREEPLDTKENSQIMEGRTSAPMLPVYFDYDSSAIRLDQRERMEINAAFMKEHGDVKIRIEGNTDPRGTKEYNLALGERRAQSAMKYMVNLGIDPTRMSTISWGEEKLLLHGHDELSWAQNRRDDFVIVK